MRQQIIISLLVVIVIFNSSSSKLSCKRCKAQWLQIWYPSSIRSNQFKVRVNLPHQLSRVLRFPLHRLPLPALTTTKITWHIACFTRSWCVRSAAIWPTTRTTTRRSSCWRRRHRVSSRMWTCAWMRCCSRRRSHWWSVRISIFEPKSGINSSASSTGSRRRLNRCRRRRWMNSTNLSRIPMWLT